MTRIKQFAIAASAIFVSGCTSINVQPVEPAARLEHVCIQENPKVWVKDFLPVLQAGFHRHGISSEVFLAKVPDHCEFIVTYTARQTWDFATYLSHAEVRIDRDGRKIAFAEYHLKGKGGFSLMKWQRTKTKMDPVIDELLSAYRSDPEPRD
ncbi:MAG: hypothetical protein JRF15_01045 [Deltaproteobacteria bacterium]|jgi:hypothetical protein|nr:hypothetical protein [Deltaproteobacteria bacterium]